MGEGGPFVKFTLPLRSDSRLSRRITAFIRFSLVLMRLLMSKFIKVVYFFCPLSSRTFASIIILSSESSIPEPAEEVYIFLCFVLLIQC